MVTADERLPGATPTATQMPARPTSAVDALHSSIGGDERTSQWTARRLAIVQAAAEVFNEVGFERGTTKQIAQRVGLSQSSVYHYVGSKGDLLVEITRRVDETLTPTIEAVAASGATARERLRFLIVGFTEGVLANQAVFAACWRELDFVPPEERRIFLGHRDRFTAVVTQLVRDGQAEGVIPIGDPSVMAQAIIGMVSSVYLWFAPSGRRTPREVAEYFLALLRLG